jgi:hypothetical protein
MKLAYFIPLNEYSNKILQTMLARFTGQTQDSEQQILQNMKRFEELSGAIAQKFVAKNPAVVRAIPEKLHQNNRFRDITQYENYDDLIRVIKSVEKKDIDIYKQAIEYYKKAYPYEEPRTIGIYVGRFKQILPQLQKDVADGDTHITDLLPKEFKGKEFENILNYRKFEDLEKLIDGGYALTADEKDELNDADTDADLTYKDNNGIEIYKGDAEHKCIKYGHNEYYGWCISRLKGSLYGSYRFINSDKMFYFVFDRKASDKKDNGRFINPYHVVVIHVDSKGRYTRSLASNNGDQPHGGCKWSEFGKYFEGTQGQALWNKIKGLEKYFAYIPPSSSERKAHGFRGQALTLDQFIDLDNEDKTAWLRINAGDRDKVNKDIIHSLDNSQINDLINHNRLFTAAELEGNKGLLKRYADYRFTRFPTEALPYPFIPYLKPELQKLYFKTFEEEYLTFHYIAKYFDKSITDDYIKQQLSILGYLPKEAEEYMDSKQRHLYEAYSVAQSQFKYLSEKQSDQENILGAVKAPEQGFILNTPSAQYLESLDHKRLNNFVEIIKSAKPTNKYKEFIFGVPTCFEYEDKLYFYTPKDQSDNELDTDCEWCIISQDKKIILDKLYNKSKPESGLEFFNGNEKYSKFIEAEDYIVGSTSIPLIAGKDFNSISVRFLSDKTQTYNLKQLPTILKESVPENESFVKRLQFRAGLK